MKGWLDKYGKELNANEGHSSAPKEWIGEGYSNVGRNYSPAWGGQFELGGEIPKAQDGINSGDSMLNNIYAKWPALKKLGDVSIKADESFTRDKTGVGDIEFFNPNTPQVTYNNGYVAQNPGVGGYGILYNPSTNDEQNVRLDMLHGMAEADPHYRRLRNRFERAVGHTDIKDEMNHWYNEALKTGDAEDGQQQWMNNYTDGQLRTLLYEGDRSTQNYSDEEANQLLSNPRVKRKFNKLNNYLQKKELGGSIPGSVGFTYARTGSTPSNGKYAKKTLPSAQNGTTTSTQTTKAVTTDDVWNKIKATQDANLPVRTGTATNTTGQNNKNIAASINNTFNTGNISQATNVRTDEKVKGNIRNLNQQINQQAIEDKKQQDIRIKERLAAKDFNEGKTKTFTLPNDETKTLDQMNWRERQYVAGKSLESKGRFFENEESLIDDINPLNWITGMAGALGEAPYQAEQSDSNMPYVSAILNPLLMGRMMGSGSINPFGKKLWTNEISNPEFINAATMGIPGMVKGAANKVGQSMESGLISKFKPSLSSSIKNVGSTLESPTAGTDYIWNSVNKNIKGNLPEGLTKQNIADVLENNLSWIESPEYLKRRMATTGETAEQVTKDVQALKKRFANTKIKFTNKGLDKGTEGLYSAQPSILSNINKDVIKIDPNQSIEEIIATIDHEVLHGLSPALKNPKLYENYPFLPTTEGDDLRNLGSKQGFFDKLWKGDKSNSYVYLEDPAEQQVRYNRLNAKIREDLNLPKNEGKLTEEQFNQWTDAQLEDKFNSFLNSGYYDVGDLLQNKASNIDRSKILEILNKAWGVIPAVGVTVAAASTMGGAQQKKQGGVIKDDRGQWDHPGEITEIQGNSMATHGYGDIPLYVVPDVGEPRMINANTGNHTFPGATKFTEFPIKKKSKGWLDKYN